MKKLLYIIIVSAAGFACVGSIGNKAITNDSLLLRNHSISVTISNSNDTLNNETALRIDSFLIDNQKFRVLRDALDSATLQQLTNGKWKTITNLGLLGMQQSYSYVDDVNADGYNDFIYHENRYITVVYLYDVSKKTLSNSSLGGNCCYWDWNLLDTSNKVFYESYSSVMMGTSSSSLFTYKQLKPHYYYTIKYFIDKNKDAPLDSVVLYKCNNGNEDDKIFVKNLPLKSHEIDEFDYGAYWQDNYKKLLNF